MDRAGFGGARAGASLVGVLAALCLIDVRVARAAPGAAPPAWETVAGIAVGIMVALAAVVLALQIRRLLRVLPSPSAGAGDQPYSDLSCGRDGQPADDCDGRPQSCRFGLQYSQFELFKRMRGDLDPQTLAAAVLEYVGEYYGAAVGVLYLARPDESLEPAATFGLAPGAVPPPSVAPGEGIVGRAAERRTVAVLDQVDARHLDLATGLGQSPPRSVIVAPFHFGGRVRGALEMAVAGSVADADLDFLRSSAENVAMALDSALARVRERRLLKETRRQAEVLAGQRRQLQQKNAELERADRYKNEFLANMSHELRTPLNSMLIISQILAENEEGNLSSEQVDNALTINQAGNELLLIINDILDMSRVEAGCLEVHPVPTNLHQILRGLEDLFRPTAERQGLSLRTTWDQDAPRTLVTDPLRLSQILKNLLNNAFKFTGEGGVELRLRRAGAAGFAHLPGHADDWVALSVSDTGIGMDAETAHRVFGAFRQGDGSIARRYGGSGLGLSISRSLAELLGGEIRVTSRVGRGSEFTLLLPSAEPVADEATGPDVVAPQAEPVAGPETSAVVADPVAGDLAGCRVLLIDTDMRTVFELSSALDGAGAEVDVARSVAVARERLTDPDGWNLVVVDDELLVGPGNLGPAAAGAGADVIVLGGTGPDPAAPSGGIRLARPVDLAAFLRLCRNTTRHTAVTGAGSVDRPEVGTLT